MNILNELDKDTRIHTERTEMLCLSVCKILHLSEEATLAICVAAKYHDIGKIKIPAQILFKPGCLTAEERAVIQTHAGIGYEMTPDFPENIREMIRYHHEDINGGGYYHLKENEIPLGAQILRVCDVYEALTADRCYRKALSREEAIDYIQKQIGAIFSYKIAHAFLISLSYQR